MLKIFACLTLLIFSFYPLKIFQGTTVCLGGKSSGEFVALSSVEKLINCDGVSFCLAEEELLNLLDFYDCKKVYSNDIGGIENAYYYSSKISKKEVVGGKRVNFHVAKSNGKITVGIPFIYYGY